MLGICRGMHSEAKSRIGYLLPRWVFPFGRRFGGGGKDSLVAGFRRFNRCAYGFVHRAVKKKKFGEYRNPLFADARTEEEKRACFFFWFSFIQHPRHNRTSWGFPSTAAFPCPTAGSRGSPSAVLRHSCAASPSTPTWRAAGSRSSDRPRT